MRWLLQIAAAAALLALAAPAAAQANEAQAAPTPPATAAAGRATTSTGGAPAAAPRIRASHRVDVIAPGEKVETVIDRLRATRSATDARGAEARSGERSGTAGGDGHREGERSGTDGPRDGERSGPEGMRGGPGSNSPLPGVPSQGERPHR